MGTAQGGREALGASGRQLWRAQGRLEGWRISCWSSTILSPNSIPSPACHILECPEGLAQDVISTIGQAFELRFKQYLKNPPKLVTPHDR